MNNSEERKHQKYTKVNPITSNFNVTPSAFLRQPLHAQKADMAYFNQPRQTNVMGTRIHFGATEIINNLGKITDTQDQSKCRKMEPTIEMERALDNLNQKCQHGTSRFKKRLTTISD